MVTISSLFMSKTNAWMNVALKTVGMIVSFNRYTDIWRLCDLSNEVSGQSNWREAQSVYHKNFTLRSGKQVRISPLHPREGWHTRGRSASNSNLGDLVIILNLRLLSVFYNTWWVLAFRITLSFSISPTVWWLFLHRYSCHLMSSSPKDLLLEFIHLLTVCAPISPPAWKLKFNAVLQRAYL